MTVYVAKGTELYQRPDEPNPSTPPEDGGGDGGTNPPPDDPGGETGGTVTARTSKPFWWPPSAVFPPAGYAAPAGWPTDFYFPGPPWPPGWDTSDITDWWPSESNGTSGAWLHDPTTANGSNGERWSTILPPGPPWPPEWYFLDNGLYKGLHRLLLALDPTTLGAAQDDFEDIGVHWPSFILSKYDITVGDNWWSKSDSLDWIDADGVTQNVHVDPSDFICVARQQDETTFQLRGYPWVDADRVTRTSSGQTITAEYATFYYPWFTWNTDTNVWDTSGILYFDFEYFLVRHLRDSVALNEALEESWFIGSPANSGGWSFDDNDPSVWGVRPPTKAQCIQAGKDAGWLNTDGSPIESV